MKKLYVIVVFLQIFTAFTLGAQDKNLRSVFFSNEIELNEYILIPEVLMYKIRNGDNDFVLYDIREREQYNKKHITGAVNYPWDDQTFQNSADVFPVDKDIFIISEDGSVSFDAVRYLLKKGFSQMYVIEGGMENWLYRDLLI